MSDPRHYSPEFRAKAIASVKRYRYEKGWRYSGVKRAADENGVTVMSIWRWLKRAEAAKREEMERKLRP